MGATLHTAGMNRFQYIKKNLWFTGVLQQDSAEEGGGYKELYNTQGRRGGRLLQGTSLQILESWKKIFADCLMFEIYIFLANILNFAVIMQQYALIFAIYQDQYVAFIFYVVKVDKYLYIKKLIR